MSVRAEIEELFQRYCAAYDAGEAEACGAGYAEDGQIYSPYGPPAKGRDAIVELHRDWVSEGEENKRMSILEMGGTPDAPWCLASYSGEIPDPDGGSPHIERGVALHVFRRHPSEGLQIVVSSLNALDDATQTD